MYASPRGCDGGPICLINSVNGRGRRGGRVAELPSGTVTFLFTDIEGSTRLWEEHPEAMQSALARHDAILRDAIAAHDGHVVKTTGDGFHAVFATAHDAIAAAVAAAAGLGGGAVGRTGPLRVRMGVHTGEAELRDGRLFRHCGEPGGAVDDASAHGGQIVVSAATEELVRDAWLRRASWSIWGSIGCVTWADPSGCSR